MVYMDYMELDVRCPWKVELVLLNALSLCLIWFEWSPFKRYTEHRGAARSRLYPTIDDVLHREEP